VLINSKKEKTKRSLPMPIMKYGNLRGTKTRPLSSLDSEIRALKRRVGRNTRAPYYFRKAYSLTAPTLAGDFRVQDINVSTDFMNSAEFPLHVLGDNFFMKSLELCFRLDSDIDDFRCVIYKPKRTGNQWQPGLTIDTMASPVDRSIYTVLADFVSNRPENDSDRTVVRYLNLRNLIAVVNRDASPDSLERGDIKIKLFYQCDTKSGGTNVGSCQTQLSITDK